MEELIKTLEEIKEHQMQTVQLARTTTVYKLADKAIQQALSIDNVSGSLPSDPMVLAKYLHDNYEEIAKRTNWQTQNNCKVEFDDLPIENKNTMILLAGKLILDFVGNER